MSSYIKEQHLVLESKKEKHNSEFRKMETLVKQSLRMKVTYKRAHRKLAHRKLINHKSMNVHECGVMYAHLIDKRLRVSKIFINLPCDLLFVSFIWRSLHFFGKSYPHLFLFSCYIIYLRFACLCTKEYFHSIYGSI